MALMSASVVVLKGSMLRAARLRTSAPSNAEMVSSVRTAARPGAMPSGSKWLTSAARHRAIAAFSYALVSQKAAMGALPALRAATDPGVTGGQYYGPRGLFGTRGYPEPAHSSRQSHDTAIQRRLWTVSEELTGITFPV
jgi:hypothetical protein